MKSLLLIIFAFSISFSSLASFNSTSGGAGAVIEPTPSAYQKNSIAFSKLTVKELQVFLGRKLTLKEKVQVLLAKKLLTKLDPEVEELATKGRNKAYMGFGFALAAILLFPLFAIPGLIFSNNALAYDKEKPGILGDAKGFARAGQIMSWVSLALMVIAILLLLILFSRSNWWIFR